MLTERQIDRLVGAVHKAELEMDTHRQAVGDAARRRAELITELRDGGLSVVDVAERLGISRQAVHRALKEETK